MISLRRLSLALPLCSLLAACGAEPGVLASDTIIDTPADPLIESPPVGTPPEAPEVAPAGAPNAAAGAVDAIALRAHATKVLRSDDSGQ